MYDDEFQAMNTNFVSLRTDASQLCTREFGCGVRWCLSVNSASGAAHGRY